MRRRRSDAEVFTLSAIDLFASAMGAFLIITIILMPDYRKEVMAEGDNTLLERLMAESQDALEDADSQKSEAQSRLEFAQQELADLMAQASALRNELEDAENQLMADEDPPPSPEPDISPEDQVSFRFLGLKTKEREFLFLVDMNRFLEPHADLMARSVIRALGFNQQDQGTVFMRWPADGRLVSASPARLQDAEAFLRGLKGRYVGSSPILGALEAGLESEARALVLFSDGLPNPSYNDGLDGSGIIARISRENRTDKEIHAVTIGDYFRYRNTIRFMETLAKANQGGFMALSR